LKQNEEFVLESSKRVGELEGKEKRREVSWSQKKKN